MIAGTVQDGNPLIIFVLALGLIPFLVATYCITSQLIEEGKILRVRVYNGILFAAAVGSLSLVWIDPTNPGGDTLIPMWIAFSTLLAILGTFMYRVTKGKAS